jgi:hypothetical protein
MHHPLAFSLAMWHEGSNLRGHIHLEKRDTLNTRLMLPLEIETIDGLIIIPL